MAEWLRRWTANPLCSARVGSNPTFVVFFFLFANPLSLICAGHIVCDCISNDDIKHLAQLGACSRGITNSSTGQ